MTTKKILMKNQQKLNLNVLVPRLIEESKKMTNEMKNRIRVNSIFSEFENKANDQFHFFINESAKRYKGSKSGFKIDDILLNSRKRCLKEAQKILKDDFYSDIDIVNEREKMKKKTTNNIYSSIRKTINTIKGLNDSTHSNSNINDIKAITRKQSSTLDAIATTRRKNRNKKNSSIISIEKLEKDKFDLNQVIKNDEQKIDGSFNKYKMTLDLLKKLADNKKMNGANKKININLPVINLLSYKKCQQPSLEFENEDDLNRVNLKKILPYSRFGKILGLSKVKTVYNNKNSFITEPNFGAYNTDYGFKNKNTNDTVIYSANKELQAFKIFNKKRQDMEKLLNVDDIPKIKNYQKIIKSKSNRSKYHKDGSKSFGLFSDSLTFYEKANLKIDEGLKIIDKLEQDIFTKTDSFH